MQRTYPILCLVALLLMLSACSDTSVRFIPGDGDADDVSPDGDEPDGDEPDGDLPDGDLPDGDLPDGDAPDGDTPDGDAPDGDGTQIGDILIVPGSLIFGEVPRGYDERQSFSLRNIGNGEVSITGLTFADDGAGVFSFKNELDTPFTLPAGDDTYVTVLAAADDATPLGELDGAIRLTWSDGNGRQQATVQLRATIVVPSAPCLAIEPLIQWEQDGQLLPPSPGYDFGRVSVSDSQLVRVTFRNCGDEDLTIGNLQVSASTSWTEENTFYMPADDRQDITLERNGSKRIRIYFAPPDSIMYGASLTFDTNAARFDWEPEKAVDSGSCVEMPFVGYGASAQLFSAPSQLDFGSVKIGCCSAPQRLSVTKAGETEAELAGIDTTGDILDDYYYEGLPDIYPFTLYSGDSVSLTAQFCPEGLGDFNGSLVFESGSSYMRDLEVPVSGRGVSVSAQTDYFQMPDRPMVDILFVVDCSGSMAEEQQMLADGFSSWITGALSDDIDLAVGVATTDISTYPGLVGEPPILYNMGDGAMSGAEMIDAFEQRVTGMSECVSMNPEQGLTSAYNVCMSSTNGFVRQDARLIVVWISDEEDQSTSLPSLEMFIDMMRSIKGMRNVMMIDAYALVGDSPDGCERIDDQGATVASAGPGTRYIQVADALNQSGDHFYSICSETFVPFFDRLIDVLFSLHNQFFLSKLADPTSMLVIVDDEVSTEYVFDEDTNSIIFNAGHEPDYGQLVTVSYEVICLYPPRHDN